MKDRIKFIDEYTLILKKELLQKLPKTNDELELVEKATEAIVSKVYHLKDQLTKHWQGDRG